MFIFKTYLLMGELLWIEKLFNRKGTNSHLPGVKLVGIKLHKTEIGIKINDMMIKSVKVPSRLGRAGFWFGRDRRT